MLRNNQSLKDVPRLGYAAPIDAARGFQRAATNAAALLSIAIAAAGCGGQQAGGPQAPPPTPVKVAKVHPAPVDDATELVATIKSLNSTTIHPRVDGQITRIYVKSGDRVKAGTPLLQIDPQRQQAAVASQDSARIAQEANVAYAQQLSRAKELIAVGAISKQELEQAETNLNTARAQLAALGAQVKEQSVTLGYYQVLAPTSGIVGDIPVRVGMRVSPDTLLTTVDQNQDLEVYVNVPLERAPELKRGLPIEIIDREGNKLADTTVNYISPTVDDQTQSVLVKGNIKGGGGNVLRSAQFVRARVIWKTTDGLVVPVVAVIRINGKHFVYVTEQKDGKAVARQRPVTLGQIIKDDYTVLGGLQANDQVVVSGVQKLMDGAPIAPSA